MSTPEKLVQLAVLLTCLCWFADASGATEHSENWPIGALSIDAPVPDLSFLNHKPAGIKGRVSAKGGDLVFEDGEPTRFWGANLQAYALFHTDPAFIEAHARRLARLGFNLVRIHHHDSHWVYPNVFGEDAPSTLQLDPDAMRKLDLWVTALKAEGIYVWLDLHVGRRITTADGVADFEELAKGEASVDIRGFNYVSPEIENLMRDFQIAYLLHENDRTGLTYAEDPAVLAVTITNENDLTYHFGNALLPDSDVPTHSARYMKLANSFAIKHGLDPDAVWRAWEHGPSKIFLNDLEQRFNDRMITALQEIGFRGLIATSSLWGGMSIAGLPSLTRGSIIDAHSYAVADEIGFDPNEKPSFLDWIAVAQVVDMPLTISEWNLSNFPVHDRFVTVLRIATSAAHQGWDAPVVYGYSQDPLNKPIKSSNWSLAEDPSMIWVMPVAALLYRQGHVRRAAKTYALCLNDAAFFGLQVTPETSIGIRTIVEQSRLVTCIPDTAALQWLKPSSLADPDVQVLDLNKTYLPSNADEITADTGEFIRQFSKRRFIVNTPKSQIVAGKLNGEAIATANVVFEIETDVAAVSVQSLDLNELGNAGRILITLAGRAEPAEPEGKSFNIEPIRGRLFIKAPASLTLHSVGSQSGRIQKAHSYRDGVHEVDLSLVNGARWLLLR